MTDSIIDGVKYIFQTQWLKRFIIIYVVISLVLGPVMFLVPLMIVRSFGDDPILLAARETSFAIGLIAGGLVTGWLVGKFANKVRLTMLLFGIMGVVIFAMGFASVFWLFIGIVALLGFVISLMNTAAVTAFQLYTDPNCIGRVFSFLGVVEGAIPLSMLIFGPLADIVRVEWLIAVSGGVIALVALCSMRLKSWREFGK